MADAAEERVRSCWKCRGENEPPGPQRLEQCESHLGAELLAMRNGERGAWVDDGRPERGSGSV